ncbi:MAG TPA: hypothetical protein VMZ51_06430 [Acidimicrobiales bacterium]|nr:hypothetical protein [Acidimicrobiales bacterium]
MTAPLDFSSIGANKPTRPAPQKKAPKRRLPGIGTPPARIAAVALVVVALAVAAFVTFGGSGSSPTAKAEKLARYCQAAVEFERLVPTTASGAEPVDTSAKAMSRLIGQLGGTLTRMKADAPTEVRSDLAATVAALQEAAKGKPAGVRSASFRARRQRIAGFRQRNCFGGTPDVGA